MVLPNSHGVSRAPQYLGIHQGRDIPFVYRTVTIYGWAFHPIRLDISFVTPRPDPDPDKLYPTTPCAQDSGAWHVHGLGSSQFARRYYGNRFYFLFLKVLRCVSSQRYPPPAYVFSKRYNSDIPGSKPASGSPRLIAAMPRPSSAPGTKTSTVHP